MLAKSILLNFFAILFGFASRYYRTHLIFSLMGYSSVGIWGYVFNITSMALIYEPLVSHFLSNVRSRFIRGDGSLNFTSVLYFSSLPVFIFFIIFNALNFSSDLFLHQFVISFILSISFVLYLFSLFSLALFESDGNIIRLRKFKLVFELVGLVLLIPVVFFPYSLYIIAILYLVQSISVLIYMLFKFKIRFFVPRLTFVEGARSLFLQSSPSIFYQSLSFVYTHSPIIFISYLLLGNVFLGEYLIILQLIQIPILLAFPFLSILISNSSLDLPALRSGYTFYTTITILFLSQLALYLIFLFVDEILMLWLGSELDQIRPYFPFIYILSAMEIFILSFRYTVSNPSLVHNLLFRTLLVSILLLLSIVTVFNLNLNLDLIFIFSILIQFFGVVLPLIYFMYSNKDKYIVKLFLIYFSFSAAIFYLLFWKYFL
jgi:hypothetical protein